MMRATVTEATPPRLAEPDVETPDDTGGPLEKQVTELYVGNTFATEPGIALIKGEATGSISVAEQFAWHEGAMTGLLKGLQLLAREIERIDPDPEPPKQL
jgi:hypothetical protein